MFVSFEQAQSIVLNALYLNEYQSNDQWSLTASQVRSLIEDGLSRVYISRVLSHLVDNELLTSNYDEDIEETVYSLTTSGILASEKFSQPSQSPREALMGVPASDRIVTIDDNQKGELLSDLQNLRSELNSGSNEVRAELGDEAARITSEIKGAEELVNAKSFRTEALIGLLLKPLRYLAEKFAGATIAELAKRLIIELLRYLNNA